VETIRLTTAQAIVRWLVNQYTVIDGTVRTRIEQLKSRL